MVKFLLSISQFWLIIGLVREKRQMIKTSRYILISTLVLTLLSSSGNVIAQEITKPTQKNFPALVSTPITDSKYHIQESFSVPILLASPNASINAFSFTVEYPSNLEFVGSDDDNSIVNFWVEKPSIEDNKIIFSGIIPSGFTETLNPLNQEKSPGLITQLIFQGNKEGSGEIKIIPELYSNDGLATLVESAEFSIKISIDDIVANKAYNWNDKFLPEDFSPIIESDPLIFEGQYFLVFSAIDKGSGIDHYEVREGGGKWVIAESPYLLSDQNLFSDIFVRAVDKAGNTRTVKIPAKNVKSEKPVPKTQVFLAFFIAIIIIILLKRKYHSNK